jgi:aromatic-L-amino-acid decarboxylase
MTGLGSKSLRLIPTDENHRIDLNILRNAIELVSKSESEFPMMIIGNAGSVDVGAIDDLAALASISKEFNCWFHIDGAYGTLGILSPLVAPLLRGIEEADSIALDFHKWGQVPYDAGFVLVRDASTLRNTFSSPAVYLSREKEGLPAGERWPCDLGPDLSRSCRALKTYFTIKAYGTKMIGEMISNSFELAHLLESLVKENEKFELIAPVALNIVCFRLLVPM